MLYSAGLTTGGILAVFTEEITAHGGRVTETFDDGRRLFTRSVLSHASDVTPGDTLRGGVALKAVGNEVCLYPYTFRLVCRNGAIIAQAIESRHLSEVHLLETESALQSIREGVQACCGPEVLTRSVARMRTAREMEADTALNLLPLLSRFADSKSARLVTQILNQFFQSEDRSEFGLANVVTATARDTEDPEMKWDLEELGGGILIGGHQIIPPRTDRASARSKAAVPVG